MKKFAGYFGGIGIILLLFGAITSLILQGGLRAIGLVELGLGLFGVSVFGFFHLGETIRTISQKRDVIFGLLGGVFGLLLLIAINVIANSHWGERKFDMTANKIHSLSDQTVNLIKDLKADIKIMAFFKSGARSKPFFDNLIEKYTDQSTKIKYEVVDPDLEPAKLKANDASTDEVIIRNETTKKSMKLTSASEEAVTTAIKKVMSDKTKNVYFLQGHGEGDLDDENSKHSLQAAKYLLENEGFSVRPLNLATSPDIPLDANIVAIWGASRSISKTEGEILLHYVERGGSLIIGQDPLVAATNDRLLATGLEPIFDRAGLEMKNAILLEYQMQVFRGQVINAQLGIGDFGDHSITAGFKGKSVAEVFMASPIAQKTETKDKSLVRTALASTSKNSWAETDIASIFKTQRPAPSGDAAGPLAIGQIAEFKVSEQIKDPISSTAKIVVFGDSDFGLNNLIQNGNNRDLFLNSFNYLTGEEVSLSIRPKTWTASTLEIAPEDRGIVYILSIFAIPQLIMILGVSIWITRRNRV